MVSSEDVLSVETEADYVHVRFRDPEAFDRIRTPDWAQDVAESVSTGAEVRTGREEPDGDWTVQSVLIDKHVGVEKAEQQAVRVVEKIQS